MTRLWILLLALFGASTAVSSHEIRPLLIDMEASASGSLWITVISPDSLTDNNQPLIYLPAICNPALLTAGKSQKVTCSSSISGHKLKVRYPKVNPAVSTMIRYVTPKSGLNSSQRFSELYSPNVTIIPVPSPSTETSHFSYFYAGFRHILSGYDHLLFLLCLLAICVNLRMVLFTVTGFTLGHSVTLLISAMGFGLPAAPVEALIAFSIVAMAAEFLRGEQYSVMRRWPVTIAVAIGLLHGFGFAGFLHSIGTIEDEFLSTVFFFNLGVEIGQLIFIAAIYFIYRIICFFKKLSKNDDYYKLFYLKVSVVFCSGVVGAFWFLQRTLQIFTIV